jgi:hypothetical protein
MITRLDGSMHLSSCQKVVSKRASKTTSQTNQAHSKMKGHPHARTGKAAEGQSAAIALQHSEGRPDQQVIDTISANMNDPEFASAFAQYITPVELSNMLLEWEDERVEKADSFAPNSDNSFAEDAWYGELVRGVSGTLGTATQCTGELALPDDYIMQWGKVLSSGVYTDPAFSLFVMPDTNMSVRWSNQACAAGVLLSYGDFSEEFGASVVNGAYDELSDAFGNQFVERWGELFPGSSYTTGGVQSDFWYQQLIKTQPQALSGVLEPTDLSYDPTYGELYQASQQFPDLSEGHQTYDPVDATQAEEAVRAVTLAWNSLSASEQAKAIQQYPWLVGNLDGVPSAARDAANRNYLAIAIPVTEGVLNSGAGNVEVVEAKLRLLYETQEQLGPLPGDPEGEDKYLLVLDPTITKGALLDKTGRVAISYGNPDTADHVAVLVPGMDTLATDTGSNDLGNLVGNAGNVYRQAGAINPDESVATVAWLGYQAPKLGPEVISSDLAYIGAANLGSYAFGVEATHQAETGTSPHLTLVAHSYGSYTASLTCAQNNPVDDLVLFGSPGTGVEYATDLKIEEGHVYAALAAWDPITLVPPIFARYPDILDFGAIIMQTDGGESAAHPGGTSMASNGHSAYTKSGTESLDNIAAVVAGCSEEVTVRGW